MNLRIATLDDVPALRVLIETSARELSAGFYSPQQIEAAVVHVFGVDTQLISDGTYFVIDAAEGPAAAGGWSARRTLYGGDQAKVGSDPRLDPRTEAARIRAFFVHPQWARRGLGTQLYAACARAAWNAGFRSFELMATRPGEPLYYALGFSVVERVVVTLPDGVDVPLARMHRAIDPISDHGAESQGRILIQVASNPNRVHFGVDQIVAGLERLPIGPVAMLTNDAARLADRPDVASRSALLDAGINVTRFFSPEHGLRAIAADGAHVSDGRDMLTGLDVTSLYGERLTPTREQLDGVDAVVVDLPDAGARFYTYAWTMTHVLDACAAAGLPVIVLDRPNPLGGDTRDAEGPLLDDEHYSLLGRTRYPIRHSLTIGELARLWQRERTPSLQLRVVPCANWRRDMHWADTGLAFVPMSPALSSYESALCYPGICLFEATNVDIGRGTDRPFRQLSAPWLDAARIAATCAGHKRLRGLTLDASGTTLRLEIRDRRSLRPVRAGVTLLEAIRRIHREHFQWATYPTVANPSGEGHFERLAGTRSLRARVDAGEPIPDSAFSVGDWEHRTSAVRLYD